ncbi:hypothetical protein [Microbispora sp. CA-102843]|uniref:hypothetical protein n=1 Tax=Microbispora sp. CA-102843 TaxID=3239952 RepID=UPI003D9098BF
MADTSVRLSEAAVDQLVRDLDLVDSVARIGPVNRPDGENRKLMVFLSERADEVAVQALSGALQDHGWGAAVNVPRTKIYVFEQIRGGNG